MDQPSSLADRNEINTEEFQLPTRIRTTGTFTTCEILLLALIAIVFFIGVFTALILSAHKTVTLHHAVSLGDSEEELGEAAALTLPHHQHNHTPQSNISWNPFLPLKERHPQEREEEEEGQSQPVHSDDAPMGRRKRDTYMIAASNLKFTAYDCSVPFNLTAYTIDRKLTCEADSLEKDQVSKKYLLMQRARRARITVKECSATISRMSYVCSAAGHTTLAPYDMTFSKPYYLTEEECDLAHQGTFLTPHNNPDWLRERANWVPQHQTVRRNGSTFFRWTRAGVTTYPDASDIDCEGSLWSYGHDSFYAHDTEWRRNEYAVVVDYMTLHVYERSAWLYHDSQYQKSRIVIDHNQLALPPECYLDRLSCITEVYTYLWEAPNEEQLCPLYKLRETEGVDIWEPDRSTTTYVSQDETMIRLKKGDPKSMCGSIAYETDYEQLYLTTDKEHYAYQRPVPVSEGSPFLYTNQKLHYVYEHLKTSLQTAVLAIRQESCKKDILHKAQEYANRAAEQRSVVDGDTVQIDGATFGTAAGEVWWVYHCRPILVIGRPTPGVCFDALPVHLNNRDLKRVLENRLRPTAVSDVTLSDEDVLKAKNDTATYGFFLEPRTHRLLTASVAGECVPFMSPLYQNTAGLWIEYRGGFAKHETPRTLSWAVNASVDTNLHDYYPEGGIYAGDMIRKFEKHHQARRMEQGFVQNILQGVKPAHNYGGGTSSNFYEHLPGMPSPSVLKGINSLAWFWEFIDHYGRICGLAIGTAIIIKCLTFLLGVVTRLLSTPQHPSYCIHCVGACLPSVTERLTRGRYKPKGAPGPCSELVSACANCHDLSTPRGSNVAIYDSASAGRFEAHKYQRKVMQAYKEQETLKRKEHRERSRGKLEDSELKELIVVPGQAQRVVVTPATIQEDELTLPSYHAAAYVDENVTLTTPQFQRP